MNSVRRTAPAASVHYYFLFLMNSVRRTAPAASVAIDDGAVLMEEDESQLFCRMQPVVAAGSWAGPVEGPRDCQPYSSHFCQINSNFCLILFNYFQEISTYLNNSNFRLISVYCLSNFLLINTNFPSNLSSHLQEISTN